MRFWKMNGAGNDFIILNNMEEKLDHSLFPAMAREIRSGSIQADPCYKSERDNACLYCDYASACRFAPGEGGDRRRPLRSLKAERVWELLLNGETAPREGENEEGGG